MQIWTIYDHPKDFPNNYVARCFVNGRPTDSLIIYPEIQPLRDLFEGMGLVCMPRDENDDPVIVESWI